MHTIGAYIAHLPLATVALYLVFRPLGTIDALIHSFRFIGLDSNKRYSSIKAMAQATSYGPLDIRETSTWCSSAE